MLNKIKSVFFQKKMQAKNLFRNKKAIELEMLGWWILGIAVLVVVIIAIIVLRGKGTSAIDFIKNLLRFGK